MHAGIQRECGASPASIGKRVLPKKITSGSAVKQGELNIKYTRRHSKGSQSANNAYRAAHVPTPQCGDEQARLLLQPPRGSAYLIQKKEERMEETDYTFRSTPLQERNMLEQAFRKSHFFNKPHHVWQNPTCMHGSF